MLLCLSPASHLCRIGWFRSYSWSISYNRGAWWPRAQCTRRTITEAKQHWSVIKWLTKNLLSRALPCRSKANLQSFLPKKASYAVYLLSLAATNRHWARVVGYGPFSLWVIDKERLCPSSGGINRLMMIIIIIINFRTHSNYLAQIKYLIFFISLLSVYSRGFHSGGGFLSVFARVLALSSQSALSSTVQDGFSVLVHL
jgi:hypothetical protein